MTFQYIRMTNDSAVVYDADEQVRQLTKCTIHLDAEHATDVDEYIKRFSLQNGTVDWILSLIFEMGLREMKRQTDLDRFMCEHEKVSE